METNLISGLRVQNDLSYWGDLPLGLTGLLSLLYSDGQCGVVNAFMMAITEVIKWLAPCQITPKQDKNKETCQTEETLHSKRNVSLSYCLIEGVIGVGIQK